MKSYFLYWVQGYDFYDKERDLYMNVVDCEVFAKDEKEAMVKAKKMVNKPNHRIKGCYEKLLT